MRLEFKVWDLACWRLVGSYNSVKPVAVAQVYSKHVGVPKP